MARKEKLDLYKVHKAEYVTPKKPQLVQTGEAKYLAIAGRGEPGGEEFAAKVGALYGMAFTIKMARKYAGDDYKVCHLEGLFWDIGGAEEGANMSRSDWRWKLLIRVPEFIDRDDLLQAVDKLQAKGKGPSISAVRLETLDEGQCVQVLHVGPYGEEPETVGRMHAFAGEHGLESHGPHHEIYLSDPRRVAPERLRTILRHPVQPKRVN